MSGPHIAVVTPRLIFLRSHWEMFPHNREVPESLVQELSGILLHAGIGTSGSPSNVVLFTSSLESTTSPNSTAAFSEAELSKLAGYVKEIGSVGRDHGFSAYVAGEPSELYLIECSLCSLFQVG